MGACHRHTDICCQGIAVPLSWYFCTNAKVGGREVATRVRDEGRRTGEADESQGNLQGGGNIAGGAVVTGVRLLSEPINHTL